FTVAIGWVFFRADTLGYAVGFIKRLFYFKETKVWFTYTNDFKFMFLMAVVFSFFVMIPKLKNIQDTVYYAKHSLVINCCYSLFAMVLFVLSISFITTSNFNPFIYFRF
ncbi:MAG TPA: hypothetical protein VN698_06115, partial [Bacteroidia bacterium]|nr:hypothetical protein [Bacteroidia bacterium]